MTRAIKTHKGAMSAGAAVVLALMLGAATGASAQCVGTYHASSGSGSAHSAATSSGVHTSSTHTASTPSSCSTSGSSTNTARVATLGTGASSEKTGAHFEHRSSAGPNKNVANKNDANKSVAGKKVSGAAVKP